MLLIANILSHACRGARLQFEDLRHGSMNRRREEDRRAKNLHGDGDVCAVRRRGRKDRMRSGRGRSARRVSQVSGAAMMAIALFLLVEQLPKI